MVGIRVIFFVGAFACFASVSGEPLNVVKDDYCEPLINVIGRHYAPRLECARDVKKIKFRQNEILQNYLKVLGTEDRRISDELEIIVKELSFAETGNSSLVDPRCPACTSAVKLIRDLYSNNYTTQDILKLAETLCIDLNVLYPEMCKGIINVFGEALSEVVKQSPHDPETFCSVIFNGICYPGAADRIKWKVELPQKPKPPLIKLNENPLSRILDNLEILAINTISCQEGKPKIKVLHMSDTHWDIGYVENTWSECRGILCCRDGFPPLPGSTEKSGKWGGWKCDIPEATFDSFLRQVKQQHKDIDYIIWTGDIPAHDLWDQTVDSNYKLLDLTVKKIQKAFPNVPIYPALGNHESIPPNLYPTKNHTSTDPLLWLYSKLNQEWHKWLPGNQSETIMRGGFYSVLIRPKLRLISMNMNYCYTQNWWLLVNGVDPERELKWLVDELLAAEEKGEKVHIIGHVPPGSNECIKGWQTNFYNIANRFENTIAGQFYGHTHSDEFEIFYDMKNQERPFGIAYLAPSLTTYTYSNPGYRIYYIDGDYEGSTRYVLDHETWILDLPKSNADKKEFWFQLYSAKSAYNMSSLFPENWHLLYESMKNNQEVMELYHNHYWKNSPKKPICDEDCRKERLCDIRSCIQYGLPKLQHVNVNQSPTIKF